MDLGAAYGDSVSFEIPTYLGATRLEHRLRPVWSSRIEDLGHAWALVVTLRPDGSDFALLLRDVQSWVGSAGLGAIRFCADGRDYVLEGVDVLSAAFPG